MDTQKKKKKEKEWYQINQVMGYYYLLLSKFILSQTLETIRKWSCSVVSNSLLPCGV